MGYFAILKMEDQDSNDVYRDKGNAETVLIKAMSYLNDKDGGIFIRFAKFISRDFGELYRHLSKGTEKIIRRKI